MDPDPPVEGGKQRQRLKEERGAERENQRCRRQNTNNLRGIFSSSATSAVTNTCRQALQLQVGGPVKVMEQ